MSAGKKAAAWN